MSEASHDQGAVRAVEPPSEPKTPMWLPALGAAIFVTIGLWWATSPPPPAPAAPPQEAASASASGAASPPAPTPPPPAPATAAPTPSAALTAPGPTRLLGDGGANEAVQHLIDNLRRQRQNQGH